MSVTSIAVIGAGGTMGRGMTANLAKADLDVRAWNRTQSALDGLDEHGAELHDELVAAVTGADAVMTILADAGPVLELAEQFLPAMARGAIWVQASTIGLEATDRCAALAEQHGVVFVDAPVLGTKKPAEDGALVVLGSGPDAVAEQLVPAFDAIGSRTLWAGEAGAGQRLKLACNTWVLSVVAGAAETLSLAEGLGIDPRAVLDAVSGGALDLPYLQLKGGAMIDRAFDPSFTLELAAKDARLVAEAGADAGVALPVVEAIRDRMAGGVEAYGALDMSATFLSSER